MFVTWCVILALYFRFGRAKLSEVWLRIRFSHDCMSKMLTENENFRKNVNVFIFRCKWNLDPLYPNFALKCNRVFNSIRHCVYFKRFERTHRWCCYTPWRKRKKKNNSSVTSCDWLKSQLVPGLVNVRLMKKMSSSVTKTLHSRVCPPPVFKVLIFWFNREIPLAWRTHLLLSYSCALGQIDLYLSACTSQTRN